MKKVLNLLLAMLAIWGVACVPEDAEENKDINVETEPLTFEIEIRGISWNSAMVEVFPSNNVDTYYFRAMEKMLFDQYESDEAFISEKVAELQAECEKEGYPIAEILSQYSDGWHYDKELASATEYCVYVFGLTAEGVVTTGLTTATFKTRTLGDDGNEIPLGLDKGDLTIDNLTWGGYMYLGDFYGNGVGNWLFTLHEEENTGTFTIEVQTDLSVTDMAQGEFPIMRSFDAGVAIAGSLDYREYLYGTSWMCYESDYETVKEMAFCQSGTVNIAKENDIFTITVDALDEYGNTIKMSYTGGLYDNTPDYTSLAR